MSDRLNRFAFACLLFVTMFRGSAAAAPTLVAQSGDASISAKGNVPANGGVRYYQVVYRDNSGPCAAGFDITNGVSVIWQP